MARDRDDSEPAQDPRAAALHQLTSSYRALFEFSPLPMWVYERRTFRFLDVNAEALRHYGYSPEEFVRMTLLDIRPAEDAIRPEQMDEGPNLPYRHVGERRHRKKDGTIILVEVTANEIEWKGRPAILAIMNDVTAHRQMERAYKSTERHLAKEQEFAELGSWEVDLRTGRIQWSDGMFSIFGLSREEIPLSAEAMLEFFHPEDRGAIDRWNAIFDASGEPLEIECRLLRKDGSIRWVRAKVEAVFDAGGARVEHAGTMLDITHQKTAEEHLTFLTSHDEITGLPNRALYLDRLQLGLVEALRSQNHAAVLSVHIDKLNTVADTGDLAVVDSVIRELATRMRGVLRGGDTLARPGGDEFLIALPGLNGPEEAAEMAQVLLAAVRSPVDRGENHYFLTASIGISLYPDNAAFLNHRNSDHLIRDANAAATQVKDLGGDGFRFFTPAIHAEAVRRLSIESDLREALEGSQFELVFQPIVRTSTRAMVGVEALLRLRHPARRSLSPAEFIHVAEATGLIVPIGTWVLRQAGAVARELQRQGRDLSLAVNVAPRQLQQPDFPQVVEQLITESGVAPRQFIFEITESTLASEGDSNQLRSLADIGVRLAIDDFGTGYSSLSYLKRFPIYALKVDKSFVENIDTDGANRAIVQAIIKLASTFGFQTVAEGVETAEQARILSELKCTMLQGYHCGRPMTAAALLKTPAT